MVESLGMKGAQKFIYQVIIFFFFMNFKQIEKFRRKKNANDGISDLAIDEGRYQSKCFFLLKAR